MSWKKKCCVLKYLSVILQIKLCLRLIHMEVYVECLYTLEKKGNQPIFILEDHLGKHVCTRQINDSKLTLFLRIMAPLAHIFFVISSQYL